MAKIGEIVKKEEMKEKIVYKKVAEGKYRVVRKVGTGAEERAMFHRYVAKSAREVRAARKGITDKVEVAEKKKEPEVVKPHEVTSKKQFELKLAGQFYNPFQQRIEEAPKTLFQVTPVEAVRAGVEHAEREYIKHEKRMEVAKEIYEEATPVEQLGLRAHTFFSPRGYEYLGAFIPGGKRPKEIVYEQIGEVIERKPWETREKTVMFAAESLASPPVEVATMAFGGAGLVRVAGTRIGTKFLSATVGRAALYGLGAVAIGTRAGETYRYWRMGEREKAIGLGITTGLGISAFYIGAKAQAAIMPKQAEYLKAIKRFKGLKEEIKIGRPKVSRLELVGKKKYPVLKEMSIKEIQALKKEPTVVYSIKKAKIKGIPAERRFLETYKFETYIAPAKKVKPSESVLLLGRGQKTIIKYQTPKVTGRAFIELEKARPIKLIPKVPKELMRGGVLSPPEAAQIGVQTTPTYVSIRAVKPPIFLPIPSFKLKEEIKRKKVISPRIVLGTKAKPEIRPAFISTLIQTATPKIVQTQVISPRIKRTYAIKPAIKSKEKYAAPLKIMTKVPVKYISPPVTPTVPQWLPKFPKAPKGIPFPGISPKQKKKYRPSVAGIALGRYAPKIPKTITGIEVRPMIRKRKRRRRKR